MRNVKLVDDRKDCVRMGRIELHDGIARNPGRELSIAAAEMYAVCEILSASASCMARFCASTAGRSKRNAKTWVTVLRIPMKRARVVSERRPCGELRLAAFVSDRASRTF